MKHAYPDALFLGRHESVHDELEDLLDILLKGEMVADRPTADRLVRVLTATHSLSEQHTIDGEGRCAYCRATPWLWSRRAACNVFDALDIHVASTPRSTQALTGRFHERPGGSLRRGARTRWVQASNVLAVVPVVATATAPAVDRESAPLACRVVIRSTHTLSDEQEQD